MVFSYNSLYEQINKHYIQHDFEYCTPAKQRFDLCYIASQAISQSRDAPLFVVPNKSPNMKKWYILYVFGGKEQ